VLPVLPLLQEVGRRLDSSRRAQEKMHYLIAISLGAKVEARSNQSL
jgi:hypothetical protein